jgi:hypothetical protein
MVGDFLFFFFLDLFIVFLWRFMVFIPCTHQSICSSVIFNFFRGRYL